MPETASQKGSQKLLLINDLPGYGKVALAAMEPVLSHMGYECFNLPTMLVSNTLDYGKFHMLETTDYMVRTMEVWRQLDFRFDAVATGFIASERQAQVVSDYCHEQAKVGVPVFVDPIMGDEGKLYNGVTQAKVDVMRTMLGVADCVVPNFTEACYLTGTPYHWHGIDRKGARDLVDGVRRLGAKSVVVTSAIVEGQACVVGYDSRTSSHFDIPFTPVDAHFPGTGDIFSAVLYGWLLRGLTLEESTGRAMRTVGQLVSMNRLNADKYKGIPLETCLDVIDR